VASVPRTWTALERRCPKVGLELSCSGGVMDVKPSKESESSSHGVAGEGGEGGGMWGAWEAPRR